MSGGLAGLTGGPPSRRAFDPAALERATLAAVPPLVQEEIDGWLLGLDDGTVGRAHSAVPLSHTAPAPATLQRIEGRYRARGLAALFRIPHLEAFAGARVELSGRGYAASKPTLTQLASASAVAGAADASRVQITAHPDTEWAQVFLGDGFDPVDGASRLGIVKRGRNSVFASLRRDGRVVAVGSACFAHGWTGIHGMRTAPAHRGRGLALELLSALAQQGRHRGIERAFLQVEAGNQAALALYGRAGFSTAWRYDYWRQG